MAHALYLLIESMQTRSLRTGFPDMYVCIFRYVCMYVCIYICIYIYIHICIYMCMYVYDE
jgi:hypothetical protein